MVIICAVVLAGVLYFFTWVLASDAIRSGARARVA